ERDPDAARAHLVCSAARFRQRARDALGIAGAAEVSGVAARCRATGRPARAGRAGAPLAAGRVARVVVDGDLAAAGGSAQQHQQHRALGIHAHALACSRVRATRTDAPIACRLFPVATRKTTVTELPLRAATTALLPNGSAASLDSVELVPGTDEA